MTTRAITLWALGALATAGLALGGPPKAAPDVLRWRPTYEEALRESQLRNVPILVSRHKDT